MEHIHTLWISPSLSSIHPLHLQRQQQWAAVIAGSVWQLYSLTACYWPVNRAALSAAFLCFVCLLFFCLDGDGVVNMCLHGSPPTGCC